MDPQICCEDNVFRTLAKSVSWQALGLLTTTSIAYAATGDLLASSGVALSSAIVGFGMYFLHERAWNLVSFGRAKKVTAS